MNHSTQDHPGEQAGRIVAATLVFNALLFVGAFVVYFSTRSQLVLAQGSDSLLDLASGTILAISVWVGKQPSDDNHPYGHDRAEPIGALITAVLAGVLAFEVMRSAVQALMSGDVATINLSVAWILGGKLGVKLVLWMIIAPAAKRSRSSALEALRIDTRNDLLACASSLIGFGLARSGYVLADGLLALPVALYIGKSGFDLARQNLRFLMGEAPDAPVIEELRVLGAGVPGVLAIGELRAQYAGPSLHVEVDIEIESVNSAIQAHDISVKVQRELEGHELVGKVFVHVDVAPG